jgi:hypothetical protein
MGIFKRPQIHVIPRADMIDHEETTDCICGPRVEDTNLQTLVTHHSLDGREFREKKANG